jgi:hypothetical protein
VKLLVHVEQYDVLGILPSQLEALALLAKATGVTDTAYIDGTADGVRRAHGFARYGSIQEFMEKTTGPYLGFSPNKGLDVRTAPFKNAWLCFGPAMGWLEGNYDAWVHIPGGELSSRDAVPIALWEASKWQEQ